MLLILGPHDHHLPNTVRHVSLKTQSWVLLDCSLPNAAPLFQILAGTEKCCSMHQTRASKTWCKSDTSAEYTGLTRLGWHHLPGTVYRFLQHSCTWGYCNKRWWQEINGTTVGFAITSLYHLPLTKSICGRAYLMPAHTMNLLPPWVTKYTRLTEGCCLPIHTDYHRASTV